MQRCDRFRPINNVNGEVCQPRGKGTRGDGVAGDTKLARGGRCGALWNEVRGDAGNGDAGVEGGFA